MGWHGGITTTHTDVGVQTVLYHTVCGTNRFIGVPRAVACAWWALRQAVEERTEVGQNPIAGLSNTILAELEGAFDVASKIDFQLRFHNMPPPLPPTARMLERCLAKGLLQYGEFGPGGCGGGAADVDSATGGSAGGGSADGGCDESIPDALVILPRGGHLVMTGTHKIVLAGEWHQRT